MLNVILIFDFFCQPKNDWEGGNANLVIASQMTTKLGKDILWVKIVTN